MKFIVTSEVPGNIFFTVPTQEELKKASEELDKICRGRFKEIYGDAKEPRRVLEEELRSMQDSDKPFKYLILKEIADISHEYEYPVHMISNSTMTAYLLGISQINPILTRNQSVLFKEHETSEFEMRIAPSVRPLISEKLNKKFSHIKSDNKKHLRITLPDSSLCEEVGELRQRQQISSEYNKDFYSKVIHRIAADIIAEPHRGDEQKDFAEKLLNYSVDDFYTLLRAYGYLFNTTESEKSVEKITDFRYCVLRDEVFDMLVQKGLPPKEAVRFCRGLMSKKLKAEYFELKARYNLQGDEALQDFEQTKYYFTSSAGANFLYLACEKEMLSI